MAFQNSKRVLSFVTVASSAIVLVALLLPAPSSALPNYATATGEACAACHVNPGGGGTLTDEGQAFAAIPTHAADPAAAWAGVSGPAPSPTAAPSPAAPPSPTAAPAPPAPSADPDTESITKGGRLYDSWWTEDELADPEGDQPLWSLQTTNTRSGTTTWRCKECHGWDYKGKDGAYGSGSRMTGFPGVFEAGASSTAAELQAALDGSADPRHDFSVLDEASIASLVGFLQNGLIDMRDYIDYSSKTPIGADTSRGQDLYGSGCASCHGADGTTLNFGSSEQPEYVGTIAVDNPWEFLHKVRVGQPGAAMPSALGVGWSTQDVVDVLSYSQSLPVAAPSVPETAPAVPAPAPAVAPSTLPATGEPASSSPGLWLALAGLALLAGGVVSRHRLRKRA